MTTLEKALTQFDAAERASHRHSALHSVDARAKLIVTLLYIVTLLSVGPQQLPTLIIFAIFPIVMCSMAGVGYDTVALRSLYTLPFIAFVGMFNPILDNTPMLYIGGTAISRGWVDFASIIVRGLLAVQMVVLMVITSGFNNVCRALRSLGLPSVFTTQLMLLHRYIYVLIGEAIDMDRARRARSYGRQRYGLKMWAIFVGQLLVRTVNRARRIHRSMLSRGFNGEIRAFKITSWRRRDTLFTMVIASAIIICRFINWDRLLSFLG